MSSAYNNTLGVEGLLFLTPCLSNQSVGIGTPTILLVSKFRTLSVLDRSFWKINNDLSTSPYNFHFHFTFLSSPSFPRFHSSTVRKEDLWRSSKSYFLSFVGSPSTICAPSDLYRIVGVRRPEVPYGFPSTSQFDLVLCLNPSHFSTSEVRHPLSGGSGVLPVFRWIPVLESNRILVRRVKWSIKVTRPVPDPQDIPSGPKEKSDDSIASRLDVTNFAYLLPHNPYLFSLPVEFRGKCKKGFPPQNFRLGELLHKNTYDKEVWHSLKRRGVDVPPSEGLVQRRFSWTHQVFSLWPWVSETEEVGRPVPSKGRIDVEIHLVLGRFPSYFYITPWNLLRKKWGLMKSILRLRLNKINTTITMSEFWTKLNLSVRFIHVTLELDFIGQLKCACKIKVPCTHTAYVTSPLLPLTSNTTLEIRLK